jgi:DNA-binding PadR family transcriptional regulator
MSGYDIKRLLKSLGWLVDGPSYGNIYTTLHALLRDQLVTVEVIPHEHKPPRKVYSVTESGRQMLKDWVEQPITPDLSLKSFVLRLILAGSYSADRLIAHLQQRQAQISAHSATLEQATEDLDDGANLQRLAASYGLALAKAELVWLERTLNQLASQPLPLEAAHGD